MSSSSTSCLKISSLTSPHTTSITSHHQYIHIQWTIIESLPHRRLFQTHMYVHMSLSHGNNLHMYLDFLLTWYQHSCDQCGKSYKTRKSLSRHRRFECRFTTERPIFQCPSCNYAAKRSDNLTKHIKTHFAKMQKEFLPLAVKMQNAIQSQLETA